MQAQKLAVRMVAQRSVSRSTLAFDAGLDQAGQWIIWGAGEMPKRLRALLWGTADAVPGDYVMALVATIGIMAAIAIGMF